MPEHFFFDQIAIVEVLSNDISEHAENVLSLGWDGNAPGGSDRLKRTAPVICSMERVA